MKKLLAICLLMISAAAYATITNDEMFDGFKFKEITYNGSVAARQGQPALIVRVDAIVLPTAMCFMVFANDWRAVMATLSGQQDSRGFVTARAINEMFGNQVPFSEIEPHCFDVYQTAQFLGPGQGVGYSLVTQEYAMIETGVRCTDTPYENFDNWKMLSDNMAALCEQANP